jgi:hypothetical protein
MLPVLFCSLSATLFANMTSFTQMQIRFGKKALCVGTKTGDLNSEKPLNETDLVNHKQSEAETKQSC